MNILESQLRMTMDRLSNGENLAVDDQWIEDAGEMFKECLKKQLTPRDTRFRLRMSNIGRPLCQLQMEKSGAERGKMPYNHILRMMFGDAIEVIVELIAKVAEVNITGGKSKAKWDVGGQTIEGENDIEIDGKVYDTKSASPWAFDNKFQDGWAGIAKDDSFGYTAQLLGYAKGTNQPQGGWIVVNKSTGELKVVDAKPTPTEEKKLQEQIVNTIKTVSSDAPFKRCFEPTEELFRRTPTGSKRLHTTCGFCSYKAECWPDAVYKPQTGSKALQPRHYWYSEYNEETL